MNREKLQWLEKLIQEEIAQEKLKDAGICLMQGDEMVFENYYGKAKRDSIYRIYSLTKPITAVAAFILYERGLLDLWEPVWHFIPEFKKMKVLDHQTIVPAQNEITIADLLNMTSGLVYDGDQNLAELEMKQVLKAAMDNPKVDIVEACKRAAQVPLVAEPGTKWHYGISADVMAAVIQLITQMPYGEFLEKEIFEPLEMVDTTFKVALENQHRIMPLYTRFNEKGQLQAVALEAAEGCCFVPNHKESAIESGGAGLFSTVADYNHFVQMLLAEGRYKDQEILGKKTVAFMRQNQLTDQQIKGIYFDSAYGYGYGHLMRVLKDKKIAATNGSLGEFGWDGMAGSYMMVDSVENLTLVYMQHIKEGANLAMRRKMRQIIYSAL